MIYPLVNVNITMENQWKSPCSMGKSTINIYKSPCSIAFCNSHYQRVHPIKITVFVGVLSHEKPPLNHHGVTNMRWFSHPTWITRVSCTDTWFNWSIENSHKAEKIRSCLEWWFLNNNNNNNNIIIIIASSLDVHKSLFSRALQLGGFNFQAVWMKNDFEVNRHHPFRLTYWKWWLSICKITRG